MTLGLDFTVILKKALCMFMWTILKFRAKSSPQIVFGHQLSISVDFFSS